ncbi:hypothetical protein C8R43DRAFT_952234 [Mycena crocata]|nr:hypothetical protein C8R43DRAFT_952231 [Mycena crocata]KAJ7148991.1 hypothetical protein C8R43DRAFT_952233 [Mycena crocata]KAJ7148992.1 hypothetical protein C8R43DRAFT_952234 [Mycena crocata]
MTWPASATCGRTGRWHGCCAEPAAPRYMARPSRLRAQHLPLRGTQWGPGRPCRFAVNGAGLPPPRLPLRGKWSGRPSAPAPEERNSGESIIAFKAGAGGAFGTGDWRAGAAAGDFDFPIGNLTPKLGFVDADTIHSRYTNSRTMWGQAQCTADPRRVIYARGGSEWDDREGRRSENQVGSVGGSNGLVVKWIWGPRRRLGPAPRQSDLYDDQLGLRGGRALDDLQDGCWTPSAGAVSRADPSQ